MDPVTRHQALFNEGVRTGDFGRWEDGLLFLASRKRDLIIRGGENIYPFEIENRLEEHPEVLEAAVLGVEDTTLGQEVMAVVVVHQGSALDADARLLVSRVAALCGRSANS